MSLLPMFPFLHRFFHPPLKFPLDPDSPAINLPVTITSGKTVFSGTFTLDTGASFTVISPALATHLDLKPTTKPLEVITAGGIETAIIVSLPQITVLDHTQTQSPALIANLPKDLAADGLLGLSFLKHYRLDLDYPLHRLTIS